jgi:hypothetical protein
MEPGGGSWRGFHEGLATSARAAGHVVDLLAYSLQGGLKHWGIPPPHSHRRTTKKMANNATSASNTTTMTSKGKGISQVAPSSTLTSQPFDRQGALPQYEDRWQLCL